MEDKRRGEKEEIEEAAPLLGLPADSASAINNQPSTLEPDSSVKTKKPEVEIHLYRLGKGPIAVFRSTLGGWDQDQLEVRDILDQYGFKSIYAFNPESGRGVPIRFHPRNGRSVLPYKDGAVIYIDGEPKDPLIKPITKILVGTAFTTVIIALLYSNNPSWLEKFNPRSLRIPPWVIACAVIFFTRMRKRTQNFLKNRGW